jgi:hypothetical protein
MAPTRIGEEEVAQQGGRRGASAEQVDPLNGASSPMDPDPNRRNKRTHFIRLVENGVPRDSRKSRRFLGVNRLTSVTALELRANRGGRSPAKDGPLSVSVP